MAPQITSPADPSASANSGGSPTSISLDRAPSSPSPKRPSPNAKSSFDVDPDGELSPSASPHVMALQGLGALDRAVKLLSAVTADLPGLMPLIAPLSELSRVLAGAVPQEIARAVAPNPLLDLQSGVAGSPLAGMMPPGGPMQPQMQPQQGPPGIAPPPMGPPPML